MLLIHHAPPQGDFNVCCMCSEEGGEGWYVSLSLHNFALLVYPAPLSTSRVHLRLVSVNYVAMVWFRDKEIIWFYYLTRNIDTWSRNMFSRSQRFLRATSTRRKKKRTRNACPPPGLEYVRVFFLPQNPLLLYYEAFLPDTYACWVNCNQLCDTSYQ
jgi:hypothetical protein